MPFIELNGKRALFLHIPKTGGTTIEHWLAEAAPLHFRTVGIPAFSRSTPQHFRWHDFRTLFGDNYFDYVFTFVRNPYDRIASEFRMQAALQRESFWKEHSSFSIWLETTLEIAGRNPIHLDNHVRPQWHFIGSNVRIFKFESGLEAGLKDVAETLGLEPPVDLPRRISTQESEIKFEWDLHDRILVETFYEKDFESFGYEKIRGADDQP